jgi:uncharacterized membrane protein YphA (DoxX/SURF4 family)
MILVRSVLGLVFIVFSWGKLQYPRIFAESLLAYQVLPQSLITVVALILPWLELLAGLSMLAGYRYRGSAVALGGLSLLFMVVLSSVVWKGLDISCGCFVGVDWMTVNWMHIVLNAVLGTLAWLVFWKGPGVLAVEEPQQVFS